MNWTGLNWMKTNINNLCILPTMYWLSVPMILTVNINRMDFAMKTKRVDWEVVLSIFIFLQD